jgi:hypothetical protein
MTGGEQQNLDALRMLRAAVDSAMVQKGLGDEEYVIGVVITLPQGNLSIARYNAAIDLLLQWRALGRDADTDEANELLSSIPEAPEAFKITHEGVALLRRMEA